MIERTGGKCTRCTRCGRQTARAVELLPQYGRKTCLALAQLQLLFTYHHMTPIESHVMILQSVTYTNREMPPLDCARLQQGMGFGIRETAIALLKGEQDVPRNPRTPEIHLQILKSKVVQCLEHDTRWHLFNDIVLQLYFCFRICRFCNYGNWTLQY